MVNLVFWRLYHNDAVAVPISDGQRAALLAFRQKLTGSSYAHEEVPCLCGSPANLVVGRRDRYGLAVTTRLCRACGMLRTSPRLTPASLARFYAEDYRPIYVGYAQAPDAFFSEQVRHGDTIAAFVGPHLAGPGTVFDVGCGAGGALLPFAAAGWRAYGCDLGDAYLARGRAAGLTLVAGDAAVLAPYAPANLIVLSHVLEHLSDPLTSLAQLADLLVADGYLYIELPGVFHIHRVYGNVLRYLQNAHLYHFTLETLTTLLGRAGFRLVQGDQTIRALFQRDPAAQVRVTPGHARRVLRYLRAVELGHLLYLDRVAWRLRQAGRRLRPTQSGQS